MVGQENRTRVLVVDDEPTLIDLLETLLSLADYDVVTASGGREALEAIAEARPEVMVLDINMPGMDGFAVLQALKDAPPAQPLRVLVLTARSAVGDVKRAKALGADDYLSKPFANKTLLARIRRLTAVA